jgi:multidrug efflux pump subunit AcrB
VEYGGTCAGQQQSFPDLVLVVVLAVALALLFEFLNLSPPIAALASVALSRSEVVLVALVARITFNICSLTGLIMVIAIAAEDGILPLDPDQKFRRRGALQGKTRSKVQIATRRLVRAMVMRVWRWFGDR